MPRLPKTSCITASLAATLWVASVQADQGGVRVAAPLKAIGDRRDIKTADQVPARIAFAPSGRQIAIARKSGGGVQVWDIESGKERLSLTGDAILAFGWSADGKPSPASARTVGTLPGLLSLTGRLSPGTCSSAGGLAKPVACVRPR